MKINIGEKNKGGKFMNDYNNFSESYSNPRVKKLRSFAQSTYGMEVASYKGIAMKTLYFVAVFAAGMGAYFYIHNFFGGGAQAFSTEYTIFVGAIIATAIAGLVASFAPKTTAVTGSIYSAGMGYALTFMSMIYAMQWKGIIVEAVTLTLLTVAVLAVIYSKGVRVGSRMKTALITCLWVSIIGGVLFMLLAWLAPHSAIYTSIVAINNGPIGILFAVIGVLIAAALLMCDFETIQMTVEQGLPAQYEWYASYGLIVGVIYLYLKILNLLAKIANNRK